MKPQENNIKIFFSYSRDNSEFTLELAKKLRENGIDLWLDQIDIPIGKRWDKEIEKALENCNTFLIILSPSSVASNNVLDEVSYALEESKHVVPIIYKECKVPFRLRRLQYIDFENRHEEGYAELLSILNDQPTPDIVAKKQPTKSKVVENIPSEKKPVVQKIEPQQTTHSSTTTTNNDSFKKYGLWALIGLLAIVLSMWGIKSCGKPDNNDNQQTKLDLQAWIKALSEDKKETYNAYLKTFPKGLHSQDAKDKIKQLEEDDKLLEATQDDNGFWETAKSQNTIHAYKAYIDKYPNGSHLIKAKKQIEELNKKIEAQNNTLAREKALKQEEDYWKRKDAWDYAKKKHTINDYKAFQRQYPDPNSKYYVNAQKEIDELNNASSTAKDKEAWRIATQANTPTAYKIYMRTHPNGEYYASAKSRIKKLEKYGTVSLAGQTYKTIKLNNKTWLAENLNYKTKISGADCYDNKSENCKKYGRLYTWKAADSACKSLGSGWRLPNNEDWAALFKSFGGGYTTSNTKSIGDPAKTYQVFVTDNTSEFNVLLGGWSTTSKFQSMGTYTMFWSSTKSAFERSSMYQFGFSAKLKKTTRRSSKMTWKHSCRCVKD